MPCAQQEAYSGREQCWGVTRKRDTGIHGVRQTPAAVCPARQLPELTLASSGAAGEVKGKFTGLLRKSISSLQVDSRGPPRGMHCWARFWAAAAGRWDGTTSVSANP